MGIFNNLNLGLAQAARPMIQGQQPTASPQPNGFAGRVAQAVGQVMPTPQAQPNNYQMPSTMIGRPANSAIPQQIGAVQQAVGSFGNQGDFRAAPVNPTAPTQITQVQPTSPQPNTAQPFSGGGGGFGGIFKQIQGVNPQQFGLSDARKPLVAPNGGGMIGRAIGRAVNQAQSKAQPSAPAASNFMQKNLHRFW